MDSKALLARYEAILNGGENVIREKLQSVLPVLVTDDPRLGKTAWYTIDGFTGKIDSILRSSDGTETICIDIEPGSGLCVGANLVEILEVEP